MDSNSHTTSQPRKRSRSPTGETPGHRAERRGAAEARLNQGSPTPGAKNTTTNLLGEHNEDDDDDDTPSEGTKTPRGFEEACCHRHSDFNARKLTKPKASPFNNLENPNTKPTEEIAAAIEEKLKKATTGGTNDDDGNDTILSPSKLKATRTINFEDETDADEENETQNTVAPEDAEEPRPLTEVLAEEAALAGNIGAFNASITIPDFTLKTTDPDHKTGPKVQWCQEMTKDLSDDYKHQTSNPYDFIEWDRLRAITSPDPTTKLKDAERLIVKSAGFKIIVNVIHKGASGQQVSDFAAHAIHSAIDTIEPKRPMDDLISKANLDKPGYNGYRIMVLKQESWEHIKKIRALFDPRSRTLVLVRPWPEEIPRKQWLGVANLWMENDPVAFEVLAKRYVSQMKADLTKHKLKITSMEQIPNSGPQRVKNLTLILFVLTDPSDNAILNPRIIPTSITLADGSHRSNLKGHWPPTCPTCTSESHKNRANCIWRDFAFNKTIETPEGQYFTEQNVAKVNPGAYEKKRNWKPRAEGDVTMEDARTKRTKAKLNPAADEMEIIKES